MTAHPGPLSLLLIIAGPAGSGKTTICERLAHEDGMERLVTCTTRQPRDGELHGRDYWFYSDEEFDRRVAQGDFLEWAVVHGRRYGTLRQTVEEKLAAHIDLAMNIDVQGVRSLQRAAAEGNAMLRQRLVTIFIMPDSLDQLRERLQARGKDGEAEIERRIETARRELSAWTECDFCIRSQSKGEDYAAARAIWQAERWRVSRLTA
jgi:guanylate kinase